MHMAFGLRAVRGLSSSCRLCLWLQGGSLNVVLNHTFREAEAMASNPPFEDPLELPA